jgi:hypothetical protein
MTEPGIIIIEGTDLKDFFDALAVPHTYVLPYSLRIWPQSDGSVKVKVNNRTWTWELGKADT